MLFERGDVVVLKDGIESGRAYDGVFISEKRLAKLQNNILVVSDDTLEFRNGRDTQYVKIMGINYPSSIFNLTGTVEFWDVEKNDTHYFRTKKTYASKEDYLADL